ncbi:MAG: hypothetical protein OEL57_05270, partial [Trichlorobacter sp.]|nr:hypothetical protein [Trichlorobacter sp.]
VERDDGRSFLIAVPEKALADRIVADRGVGIASQKELHEYLLSVLRIDPTSLYELDPTRILEIAHHYRSRRIRLLSDLVARLHKGVR